MPKGQRADGTPIKPPGRPNNNRERKGPFWFDQDVLGILNGLPDGVTATAYIQDAVREKRTRELSLPGSAEDINCITK